MKTKLIILSIAFALAAACSKEKFDAPSHGIISFAVNQTGPVVGKSSGDLPTDVVVSVEDATGKSIFENKRLSLTATFGQFTTTGLQIGTGTFTITKFFVLEGDKLVQATPRIGSEKASQIQESLPVQFTIGSGTQVAVTPPSIFVSTHDTPQAFGYSSFGFDIENEPSEEEWINIRVKFEPIVGGIYYQNVDTEFAIIGYNDQDVEQWNSVLPYTGPRENDLRIKAGYDHYSLEVKKWGIDDTQLITGEHLYEGRVKEGSVPTTYVFGGSVQAKRLKSYTTYSPTYNDQKPETKTTYEYNAEGKLTRSTQFIFSQGQTFEKNMINDFEYTAGTISKITTTLADNTAYSETTYTYLPDGLTSQIVNKNPGGSGITTTVSLTYTDNGRTVKAQYSFSNGQSFSYEFITEWNNLKSDQTNRGGQLCSTGTYAYDKSINPFRHLGYTDYLMRNLSISNRVSEQVNYVGCSYPSIIPESVAYTYDDDEYPLTALTTYKGKGGQALAEYEYEGL